MRVLVVGGGICAASMRHYLRRSGSSAVSVDLEVWDKGGSLGGRMTTSVPRTCLAGAPVDIGLQYVTLDPKLADTDIHDAFHAAGLLKTIPASFIVDSPDPDHAMKVHAVAPQGSEALVYNLMDLDAPGCVAHTRRTAATLELLDDGRVRATDAEHKSAEFDAVVVTAPVPQAVALLNTSPEIAAAKAGIQKQLDAVTYSCRFAASLHFPLTAAAAAVQANIGGVAAYVDSADGALRYLSAETEKRSGSGRDHDTLSLLLHSDVPFGLKHANVPEEDRRDVVLPLMKAAFEAAFDPGLTLGAPTEERLLYWRFSQVYESPFTEGVIPVPGIPTVLLSGDAFAGKSGMDATIRAGRQAADALMTLAGAAPPPSGTRDAKK